MEPIPFPLRTLQQMFECGRLERIRTGRTNTRTAGKGTIPFDLSIFPMLRGLDADVQ
jgi:hypothetical protein